MAVGRPVIVLIPAFNEEDTLADVLAGVRAVQPEAELVVVDDGSSDRTAAVAAAEGAAVLRHPFNLGYGAALQTGYKYALARGADELVQMDGDGQHEAGEIEGILTPMIQELGDRFGRGEVFLPQLMVAAEAMKSAVTQVKTHLPDSEDHWAGHVVFATVKGDIHSIGKDICVSLLESQGFEVKDLGVDVAVDEVVAAAVGADVVCLSALMTTTLPAMQHTVETLNESSPALPVLVGGAVVTGDWATSIGAGYAADAPGCVSEVQGAMAANSGESA